MSDLQRSSAAQAINTQIGFKDEETFAPLTNQAG